MTKLIESLGELALASRLKRLSERLMADVGRLYRERGLAFEPRWFLLFFELGRCGPLSVTDLAGRIGVTHPAVNQGAAELLRAGLLRASGDRRDKRRRLLELSPKGQRLLAALQPLWREIRQANAGLLDEASPGLLGEIGRLERALDGRSMHDRVTGSVKQRQLEQVEITGYRPALKKHFKELNLEWLEKYFTVEQRDLAVLDDPNQSIIKKGGKILFARLEGEIVGTCAIVPEGPSRCELVKMAVSPRHQGRQIGRKLALAAIDRAKKLGARELVARTSPRLEAANKLYRSLGFAYTGADRSGDYRRPTIVLVLKLK